MGEKAIDVKQFETEKARRGLEIKMTREDMGRERFEQIIRNTYESTQRYVLCYKFDLNNVTLIGN